VFFSLMAQAEPPSIGGGGGVDELASAIPCPQLEAMKSSVLRGVGVFRTGPSAMNSIGHAGKTAAISNQRPRTE
jgi:hypothetical protein